MQFTMTHPVLLVLALGLGVFLFLFDRRWEPVGVKFLALGEKPAVLWACWFLFAAFYFVFYLARPVYYTGFLGGVVGDNYMYLSRAVADPSYVNPQHFYFPFVPAQIFWTMVRQGFFQSGDPAFLEKAFQFFSLPNRLFAVVGFWAFHGILKRWGFSPWQCFWGVAFLATSFGYWFWALQSNAIGFLLPLIFLAVYATFVALEKQTAWRYCLSAALVALCFFVHIGSGYVVVGIGAGTLAYAVRQGIEGRNWKAFMPALTYAATACAFILVFWMLLRGIYGERNLPDYLPILADRKTFGDFSFQKAPILFVRDGLSTILVLLLGFLQAGSRHAWESGIIVVEMGIVFALLPRVADFVSAAKGLDAAARRFVILLFFSIIICVAGFSLRKTWFQYYTIVAPASCSLFVFWVFTRRPRGAGFHVVALPILVVCNLFMNGYSSTRVDLDRGKDDHVVYRTLKMLKNIGGDQTVLFVGPSKTYPYNFYWLTCYYAQPASMFKSIRWTEEPVWKDVSPPEAGGEIPMDTAASFHLVNWADPQKARFGRTFEDFDLVVTVPDRIALLNSLWPGRFQWQELPTNSAEFPILFKSVNKVPK